MKSEIQQIRIKEAGIGIRFVHRAAGSRGPHKYRAAMQLRFWREHGWITRGFWSKHTREARA